MTWSRDELSRVLPEGLVSLLRAKGWVREQTANTGSTTWVAPSSSTHPVGSDFLLLTNDPKSDDYPRDVALALQTLAHLYGRSEQSWYLDAIQGAGEADVIRFTAEADGVPGAISLDSGVHFFEGIRDTLAAGVKSQFEKIPYYGNRYWKGANGYLASVRLGQTEPGSYVVRVLAGVTSPPDADGVLELESEDHVILDYGTTTRMLTESLVGAINAASQAVHAFMETGDDDTFVDYVDQGISADLFRGLAVLTESAGRTLTVAVDWAEAIAISGELPREYKFSSSEAEVLRKGRDILRFSDLARGTTIVGLVIMLNREGRNEGIVAVEILEGGAPRYARVRMRLSPLTYLKAVDAHARSRPVVVRGDLIRAANRYWMRGVSDIEVIRAEDTELL